MTIRTDDYYHTLTNLLHSLPGNTEVYHNLCFLFDRLCRELTTESEEACVTSEIRLYLLCDTYLSGTPEAEELRTLYLHIQENLRSTERKEQDNDHTVEDDIKKLASIIAILTGTTLPEPLLPVHPVSCQRETEPEKNNYIKCLRVIYIRHGEKYLKLANYKNALTATHISLEITATQENELFGNDRYSPVQGMQLNLIDVHKSVRPDTYTCGMIVTEPDFLLDISTIAECFRPYGAHPLNYFLGLLSPEVNTRHILLGNIANLFLDELVNETPEKPASYLSSMQKAFRQNPFNIAACHDLKDEQTEKQFFSDCKKHFDQLSHITRKSFPRYHIDREKGMLEPSFICNALGLQGRLDFLTSDFSTFIELKSGKAKEEPGASCISHQENHYVQMMLYFAVLRYNLEIDITHTRAFLLYSRYPALYHMTADWELVKKAIGLRNRIVTLMYHIQRKNNPAFTLQVLYAISPVRLNLRNIGGPFWNEYLRKPIDTLSRQLSALSEIEKEYFSALFTFITKEQYISKAGDTAYQTARSSSRAAEMSISEKLDAGEIMVGLVLQKNLITEEEQVLQLKRERSGLYTVPNFREGDRIIIYRRDYPEAHARNQQIFKGTILRLTDDDLFIQLLIRQQNSQILPLSSLYAVERDFADTGYSAMYRNLSYFLNADPERRNLLLCRHRPQSSVMPLASHPGKTDLERITEKAVAAKDYFLLIGPPGTGKTSQALRKMVEAFSRKKCRILLAAYTNRAVDEICHTLFSIRPDFPFIRIGQEASCHPQFRPFLLKNKIADCRRRNEVDTVISDCPVFVATLTTLSTRMELLRLKQFDVAIIDEASQILEPQLIGILCARHQSGENAVKKFIFIGDHKQLPAIVQQNEKQAAIKSNQLNTIGIYQLTESLFERLYRYEKNYSQDNDSPFFDMLCRQGRMHPEIAEFPSRYFYEGKLDCIPLPHQEEISLPDLTESNDPIDLITGTKRLVFFAVRNVQPETSYKTNRDEARLTARLTRSLYYRITAQGEHFNATRHIGIITPYRHQIAMIHSELRKLNIPEIRDLTIDTVERFQGSQRDIIIYSCCINTPFQLEYISNTIKDGNQIIDRKLNVALTRARKQLFIIGNPEYLEQNPIYNELITHIRKKNGYIEKWSE